jgi:hypothetical protein
MASCPHCKARIHEIRLQSVTARPRDQRSQRYGLLYCCPNCDNVLGAGPDEEAERGGILWKMQQQRIASGEAVEDDEPEPDPPIATPS